MNNEQNRTLIKALSDRAATGVKLRSTLEECLVFVLFVHACTCGCVNVWCMLANAGVSLCVCV